ncbi:hypothetical protein Cpap_0315 [Ruminiclostridium papyrosolvens DSM 2782]|uniref:Glycosyltransferase RgtA/B/C/D-like domain-containing protein n=1 Tax=Ruminiclostridium papyrosolvens DSM 2782 TaxID=588581 RepID=F1TGP5_9FIRM|nr:glycosyltransferase family 39 protein [Ruminiclostridium papyrosolvens]EGD46376.1 hypothetical protein Cpap_0315 [Ruminiclostridium papyrosolvens DSM 2782]WES34011.1 glycosyltransferase family 39 protein [Ruminiclostridium papyrosolvens DSM 2782]
MSIQKDKIQISEIIPQKLDMLTKLVLMIFTAYIMFLTLLNIGYVFHLKGTFKYIIIVVPVFVACIFIANKLRISKKAFLICIFILAFCTKALIAITAGTRPVSDFKTFYDCAVALQSGNKSWSKWTYFSDWAYQTGPITYYAILIKIFGTGLLPLKLCNCAFMAGTNTLIYLIARKITNEYAARSVALLYVFYPAPYFLASVLTNQHFAAFMFYATIYVLMISKFNFWVRALLGGIIAALGNAVRPLGTVIIAAAIVWCIIELIRTKKVVTIGLVLIMMVTYSTALWGISSYLIHEDISPYGLSNNFPLWKFVVGLNEKTSGQYSLEDQSNIFYIDDKHMRDTIAKATIKERINIGPKRMLKFMVKKQEVMWGSMDTLRWGFYIYKNKQLVPPEDLKIIENRLLKTEKVYYLFALLVLALGTISLIRQKKNINSVALYVILLLMGYFFVHMLIEVQVRYRYFALISVFILLAYGVQYLVDKYAVLKNKKYTFKASKLLLVQLERIKNG